MILFSRLPWIFFSLLFFTFSFSEELPSSNLHLCYREFDSLPILAGGRVKPLEVHAQETLKFIFEKRSLSPYTATESFCLLSYKSLGFSKSFNPEVPIHHVKLREFLQVPEEAKGLSLKDFLDATPKIREEYSKESQVDENSSYAKALNKALNKAVVLTDISLRDIEDQHYDWRLYHQGEWLAFLPFLSLLQKNAVNDIKAGFLQTSFEYIQAHGDHYLLELQFVRMHPFSVALLITLIALFLLLLMKKVAWALSFAILSTLIQIAAISTRVMISGRGPVTNMYETVIFACLATLFLSLLIYAYKREKIFLIAGLSFNTMGLFMAMFANNMLDSSIKPLVPVLRDNFWLATHVTSVTFSYGAFALSWMIANILMIKSWFSPMNGKDRAKAVGFIHACMKWGVVFLAAGVILGGVWADYSWGRFWGWDPKETWSLIVLMVYMAILHGKMTTWIKPKLFVPLASLAFLFVMMAWFGVNFILASGLHSYGFSQGADLFLGGFFILQILIASIELIRMKKQVA